MDVTFVGDLVRERDEARRGRDAAVDRAEKAEARVAELQRVLRLVYDCADEDVREGRAEGTTLYAIEAEARAALGERQEG